MNTQSNLGETVGAVDWSKFAGIETLNIEFADSTASSSAAIFGNGNNQVGVTITVRCYSKDGGYLPITEADLKSSTFLCYYEKNPVSKLNFYPDAAYNTNAWWYTDTANTYNRAYQYASSEQAQRLQLKDDGYAQVTYYVYWNPNAASPTSAADIAGGININGAYYTTNEYEQPSIPVYLNIRELNAKNYTTEDTNFTRVDTASHSDIWVDTRENGGSWADFCSADQDNYYLSLKDPNFRIQDFSGWDTTEPFYIRGMSEGDACMNEAYLFTKAMGTSRMVTMWYYNSSNHTNKSVSNGFNIPINDRSNAITLSRIAYRPSNNKYNTDDDYHNDCIVEIFDQYGNSGNFRFYSNDDDGWGNLISVSDA
ncbi:hypothetical protein [Pseudomonas chlororaphis]|uniref:hypothetical protein n=1 Tax=Pseudomonas chlororaphis TaxID=587753 RepID=UPI001CF407F7|nr:hypothetical protein [Pseudomonas chlororaphis]UCR83833.1 hypothetical protein K9V45_27110 [Pseudomonas chlororaphis]